VDASNDDDLDTPTWMRQVIESGLTDRVLAKARRRGESLRDAKASTDPRADVFINGTRDTAEQARKHWLAGISRQWWTTASRQAALNAYIAALEFSEVDEQAAAVADKVRRWFASPIQPIDNA
jgi:hypothetical protein